jgi:hypothetical protein
MLPIHQVTTAQTHYENNNPENPKLNNPQKKIKKIIMEKKYNSIILTFLCYNNFHKCQFITIVSACLLSIS